LSSESNHIDTIDLEKYIRTPCRQLENKTMEGWIRRQRIFSDPVYSKQKKTSQWMKAWVIIVDNRVLLSYSNQFARSGDLALDIHKCFFNTSPVDIKTSKKFVFCLSSGRTWYHFAPYTQQEYQAWASKIVPLIRMTETSLNNNSPPETMTNNCIHNRSDDSVDSALPSSPSANTLPRTFHNKGLFVNVTRQGSLSRNFRSTTPSEFLSHSSAANSVEDMKSLKTVR